MMKASRLLCHLLLIPLLDLPVVVLASGVGSGGGAAAQRNR